MHPIGIEDPHVCENGARTILSALRELRKEGVISDAQKPIYCTISTTGLSAKRDVPYSLMPLYHVALAEPHKDKHAVERLIASAAVDEGVKGPISGFIIARPTLLTDGQAKGLEKIKTGWEPHPYAEAAVGGEGTAPAIGFAIARADVGLWIFEEVVKGGRKWSGKCVSLAY